MAAPSVAASPTAERILVAVRLRPLNEEVDRAGDACVWDAAPDGRTLRLDAAAAGKAAAKGAQASYVFERVFGPGASNAAVYHACASPLVHGALAGVNCALLAYGQTGSGKTYTMNAMVAAAAEEAFALTAASARERDFTVSVNALEVYNEEVRDLLSEDTPSLRLLDDPHRGTVAEGAREARVRSAAELRALLAVLQPRRQVAHNGAHEASSRSHLLVRLLVESWPLPPAADAQREPQSDADSSDEECWLHRVVDAPAEDAAAAAPTPRSVGLLAALNFVDLAGSERTGSNGATSAQGGGGSPAPEGLRLKEGLHINRSLLTLGAVIRKLGEGAKGAHVPFRDSKLTRLLAAALGGGGRAAVVCCVSPAAGALEASRSALLFAESAKRVATSAKVNELLDDAALLRACRAENAALRAQLAAGAQPEANAAHAVVEPAADDSQLVARLREELARMSEQLVASAASEAALGAEASRLRAACTASDARAERLQRELDASHATLETLDQCLAETQAGASALLLAGRRHRG